MLVRTSKDKDHPYVIINKNFLEDINLSLKAKGLLSYCMSKPDGWSFHIQQMTTVLKEGRDSLRAAFNELIKYGYCVRQQHRSNKGSFNEVEYILYETPINKSLPETGNPAPASSAPENATLVSNEAKINNETTTRAASPPVVVSSSKKRQDLRPKRNPPEIPDCLLDIEDLTEDDKIYLSRYPLERILLALDFAKDEEPRESLAQLLIWCCKQKKPPVSKSKSKSKGMYEKYRKLDKEGKMHTIGKYTSFQVLEDGILFCQGPASSTYRFDDPKFQEYMERYFKIE